MTVTDLIKGKKTREYVVVGLGLWHAELPTEIILFSQSAWLVEKQTNKQTEKQKHSAGV